MAYDASDKPGSNQLDRNPDPITGAPGSHPLGTGIGTGSGALTGAALGMIGGPVGAAIGLIAGGIVGAFTGHAAGEYNDPTEDYSKPGQHPDPVARATNPTPATAMPAKASTSSVTPATTAKPLTGTPAPKPLVARDVASTTATRHRSLDDSDDQYYRESHKKSFTGEDLDYDADLAPAYGYGTEVSRQSAGTKSNFTDLDTDLRGGWDHVKGTSKLSYDQARPAIEEAYNRSLRLHEERLNVSKDTVQTGDVSIRKEIVTERKQIEVPVEREEVVITTRSINDADGGSIDDTQTIRVPISEERVNIDKQVVTTGEVRLDKKKVQETQSVVDNLRKEVVKVDKTGDVRFTEETTGTGL